MEDLKGDKNLQSDEIEYEIGNRLFMTRLLLEFITEDLCTTSTISQNLQKEPVKPRKHRRDFLPYLTILKGLN